MKAELDRRCHSKLNGDFELIRSRSIHLLYDGIASFKGITFALLPILEKRSRTQSGYAILEKSS
jgi:hypothetical protein